jgi:hypothetical protein
LPVHALRQIDDGRFTQLVIRHVFRFPGDVRPTNLPL